jgi:hypothetical protein
MGLNSLDRTKASWTWTLTFLQILHCVVEQSIIVVFTQFWTQNCLEGPNAIAFLFITVRKGSFIPVHMEGTNVQVATFFQSPILFVHIAPVLNLKGPWTCTQQCYHPMASDNTCIVSHFLCIHFSPRIPKTFLSLSPAYKQMSSPQDSWAWLRASVCI